mmetsp:Transcript_2291/g.8360  ORF Transcript_2291/g.8360 Transcript_2291/m.8360 type:complete len:294 (-) Transcript_2291:670-1551(-)
MLTVRITSGLDVRRTLVEAEDRGWSPLLLPSAIFVSGGGGGLYSRALKLGSGADGCCCCATANERPVEEPNPTPSLTCLMLLPPGPASAPRACHAGPLPGRNAPSLPLLLSPDVGDETPMPPRKLVGSRPPPGSHSVPPAAISIESSSIVSLSTSSGLMRRILSSERHVVGGHGGTFATAVSTFSRNLTYASSSMASTHKSASWNMARKKASSSISDLPSESSSQSSSAHASASSSVTPETSASWMRMLISKYCLRLHTSRFPPVTTCHHRLTASRMAGDCISVYRSTRFALV